MPTYLPYVPQYVPQIQPFSPDYNFYAGALNFKQSRQDAARKKLSSVYGSLLNAPMVREDNLETRNKFFKIIDQDIKRMAGLDLSLEQNVDAAASIFNQLLDNKVVVKDMAFTKNYQNQLQRSQSFKNCIDPEKCGGGWWEGGDRLLQYNLEQFKTATPDQALQMGNAKYVPYQDITKKALALAEAANLNVSIDQITGQWITTTKNGQLLMQPLQNLFMGSIGKDPKVMEYFKAQAEVARKDFMFSNKDQYGSLEMAEQAYIEQYSSTLDKMFGGTERTIADAKVTNEAKIKKLEEEAANSIPSRANRLQQFREELEQVNQGYTDTLETVKTAQGEIEVAKRNQKYTGDQLDRILGTYGLGLEIGKIAQTLAFKDYEVSHKVNPYGLEAVQFKNQMLLEEYKHRHALEHTKYKHDLKLLEEQIKATGGGEYNVPNLVDVPGSTSVGETDPLSYKHANRGFNEFYEQREGVRVDVSANEKAVIGKVYSQTKLAAENGDLQAKEDLVYLTDMYLASKEQSERLIAQRGTSGFDGSVTEEQNEANQVKPVVTSFARRQLNSAKTLQEKYDIIKNMNLDLNALSHTQSDYMYTNGLTKLIDPSKGANDALRKYLTPVWENTVDTRRNIQAKQLALQQLDKYYAEESVNVIQAAKASNKYDKKTIDMLDSYVNKETGYTNDVATFVSKMVEKGYTSTEAQSLYRGDQRAEPRWWQYITGPISLDTPTTQANEDALGYVDRPGFFDTPGYADQGIHDIWKRAFTEYSVPRGNSAWVGLTGAGDHTVVKGLQFDVDPQMYRSVGTQGTVGFLKDSFSDPNSVFTMGGFGQRLPENNETARKAASYLLNDLIYQKKGDSRPLVTVTYSDLAASDASKVALNIKFNNVKYLNQYKGSEKEPLFAKGNIDNLSQNGITIYVDKGSANNLFTQNTKVTTNEVLMNYSGKIEFNQSPYVKDLAITQDPQSGNYVLSGYGQAGLNPDGTPKWQYIQTASPMNLGLNDFVKKTDELVYQISQHNKLSEDKYKLQKK
jgi:hypothetical protein